jgi:hypothetical protein
VRGFPKAQQHKFNGMAIYIMWNIWKERNRRIFENNFQMNEQVAQRVKDDIDQHKRAFEFVS